MQCFSVAIIRDNLSFAHKSLDPVSTLFGGEELKGIGQLLHSMSVRKRYSTVDILYLSVNTTMTQAKEKMKTHPRVLSITYLASILRINCLERSTGLC